MTTPQFIADLQEVMDYTFKHSLGRKLLFLAAVFGSAAFMASQTVEPTPRQMVDALHGAFGQHHARAVHAKGVIVEGYFVPAETARRVTIAPHLQTGTSQVPVVARFSDFTGIPDISDTNPLANPRGFAIKFRSPDGTSSDIVSHSFNGFPVATVAEFRQLLIAIAASGKDAPHPTELDKFLEGHPAAKAFLTTQKPAPVSWATTPYFGVNSFKFTNAAGECHFVRYQFVPLAGEQYLPPEQIGAAEANYLSSELSHRLAAGPVRFRLQVQLSGAGDKTDDPSVAWPSSREVVELGTIVLSKQVTDAAADKRLLFLPGAVTKGIEIADPMLQVRTAAYPISAAERQ